MSILVNENTRVLIQGITGGAGTFHTRTMIEYNTPVVAGVTPRKGGTVWEDRVPVFDRVEDAVKETGANASVIFVPAKFAGPAIIEAIDAEVDLIVAITEGIPTLDMLKVRERLQDSASKLIGPNCPGVITPGVAKLGIMPAQIHKPGKVGLMSRSGTLTYEAVGQLTALGLGQSTCLGIGGDPVGGLDFIEVLEMFAADDQTEAVVMIGEIGGNAEERAASYIKEEFSKPVAAFIAGRTAPPGKRMGHAGAIISGGKGTAGSKIQALENAGIAVAPTPADIGSTLASLL